MSQSFRPSLNHIPRSATIGIGSPHHYKFITPNNRVEEAAQLKARCHVLLWLPAIQASHCRRWSIWASHCLCLPGYFYHDILSIVIVALFRIATEYSCCKTTVFVLLRIWRIWPVFSDNNISNNSTTHMLEDLLHEILSLEYLEYWWKTLLIHELIASKPTW